MDAPQGRRTGQWLLPLLKVRIWLAEVARHNELQTTLVWAGLVGLLAGASSVGFRKATDLIHYLLTGHNFDYVKTFQLLPDWQRLVTPAAGGALAGLTLLLGARLNRRKSSTDYMEAIVLGTGQISSRSSFVKCASALFTIASGGSIGREGPLVQLAAVLASLTGRWARMTTARLRLLVACGAAGGIASAYNAPIGGALFVAEIVLGTLAMESFGPLVFSSVVATLTVRQFLGTNPLYEIPHTAVQISSNWEIIPHLHPRVGGRSVRALVPARSTLERASLCRDGVAHLRTAGAGRADRRRACDEVTGSRRQRLQRGRRTVARRAAVEGGAAHSGAQTRGDGGDVRLGGGRRRVHADAFRRGQYWIHLRARRATRSGPGTRSRC